MISAMKRWMYFCFLGGIIMMASCRTPHSPKQELSSVRRITLCPIYLAPTNFVLTPLSTRRDSGTEVGDLITKISKPLQRNSTLWDRNADIREQVKPEQILQAVLTEQLPSCLARSGNNAPWMWVSQGEPADAELRVTASQFGFQDDSYSSLLRTVVPRITFQVILAANPPVAFTTNRTPFGVSCYVKALDTNPVLWKTNFTIARSSRPVFLPGSSRDAYIRDPDYLRRSIEAISRQAATRVADELYNALKQ
jgi:hypothetical protein